MMRCHEAPPSGASASASMYARCGNSGELDRAVTRSPPFARLPRLRRPSSCGRILQPECTSLANQGPNGPMDDEWTATLERRAQTPGHRAPLANGEVVGFA